MGRTLCSSDWHGSEVGFKVLEWLQPDDVLYFLGDSSDRGKYGFELMTALLKDSRVRYILGNHDEMFLKTMSEIVQGVLIPWRCDYELWMLNGGYPTYQKAMKNLEDSKYCVDKLKKTLQQDTYVNQDGKEIILEHAGFTPGIERPKHDPLWDRGHFHDKWAGSDNCYLIHGHTPVQYLKYGDGYIDRPPLTEKEIALKKYWGTEVDNTDYKILRYCDGHKFDVDCCTIVTDKIALLNLNTFEEIYFTEEGVIK